MLFRSKKGLHSLCQPLSLHRRSIMHEQVQEIFFLSITSPIPQWILGAYRFSTLLKFSTISLVRLSVPLRSLFGSILPCLPRYPLSPALSVLPSICPSTRITKFSCLHERPTTKNSTAVFLWVYFNGIYDSVL